MNIFYRQVNLGSKQMFECGEIIQNYKSGLLKFQVLATFPTREEAEKWVKEYHTPTKTIIRHNVICRKTGKWLDN